MKKLLLAKDGTGQDLITAKVASMFVLGCGALICAVVPILIARYALRRGKDGGGKGRAGLELFLRFGGGILLATTFLHLLPEVREGIERLQLEDAWPVQIPELVMSLGFFLMYAVEEVAHLCLHTHSHTKEEEEGGGGHSHVVGGPPVRGLLIIIALGIHQVFEGLAVGLESSAKHVWVLLGAVAAHKLVIAVCVGAEIASSRIGLGRATLCVAVFAIASPIGIGIGLGLGSVTDESSPTMNTVSVVLQGLATGTLLYVVFFEILIKVHPATRYQGIYYCLATFIGFVLMLILLIFFDS